MPGPRRKTLTEADRQEWAIFAQKIRPLVGRAAPALPIPVQITAKPPTPSKPTLPDKHAKPIRAAEIEVGSNPGGLDKSSWNRLRTGKQTATRTIDLHGRTAQRAYQALHGFLLAAHADHVRCVEIITGRGTGETGGVIRRELPMWLNLPALRPLILAASHPHPANPGSVRILLRRPK